MSDRQYNPLGQEQAPAAWVIPSSLQVVLKTVYASFDGSGAGSSFVPCLELVTDSGHVEGAYPLGGEVAAGASADATWFPRGGLTGFIRYVTPNVGSWLSVATTAGAVVPLPGIPTLSGAMVFIDNGDGGIWLTDSHGSAIGLTGGQWIGYLAGSNETVYTQGGNFYRYTGGGNVDFYTGLNGSGTGGSASGSFNVYTVSDDGTQAGSVSFNIGATTPGSFAVNGNIASVVYIDSTGAADRLGFFNVGPVAQQPTPVTLADVIALLQAYGLSA